MKTPSLSPELEALLAPHRRMLPLAGAVEARAIARAAAAAPDMPIFRAPVRAWWPLAAAACGVLALGAGAYAARGWTGWPASSAPPIAPVATKARPAVVVAPELGHEAPATLAPPAPRAPKHVVGSASAAAGRPTNAELQLLRLARQDLSSGDFAGTLAAVAEHARRFRHGSLVEEREALRVKSLAGLGRRDEAQRAAAQFHARFPHSVLLSTFERMTEPER